METRNFGRLGEISALTLGGGGIGQVWGATSRDESVATVREAVDRGITFLDVAPTYGNGEAEVVIGHAFSGSLPAGVRVSTKCRLGAPPADQVFSVLERSLEESLARMKLDRVDLFFLHNQLIPDGSGSRYEGTPQGLFTSHVVPAFQRLVDSGRVGAWGVTGIGVPDVILATLQADPVPAAVQAVANLLDSPGSMKRFDGPAKPREIIAAAQRRGIAVMGIRAVQAGALTGGFDRELAGDHPDSADFLRAGPFRKLARDLGEAPAALAHRYSLSMDGVSTVILGVKNRVELRECVDAEARGRLDTSLIARIDSAVSGA